MSASLFSEKLKSIRAILFDKDGTLIDFDRTWFTVSWNLAQRTANGDEHRAKSLLDAGGYDWEASRFRANSVIAAGTVEDIVQLWHPDIDEAGFKAKIAEFDSYTAKALGIDHLFDVVIGYDTAERPKPFADPLLYFAKKVGLEPGAIAMVGDNLHDLETAHAAKAGLGVGVLSGNSPREALEPHADVVLDSIADLPALFK